MVVLVTGVPGTGKSTVADAVGRELGATVLGWDWAMAGLTANDEVQATIDQLPAPDRWALGWSILLSLATAELRRGSSVVLDGVARDPQVQAVRALAAGVGARSLVIACTCSDPEVHRSRVEDRRRNIPGWYELQWPDVAASAAQWSPPADVDIELDAVLGLEDNLSGVRALLRR
jgi:predicted kinase